MKKEIITCIIALVPLLLNAQDQYASGKKESSDKMIYWSFGIEPSLPIGHFNDLASFGLGASFQGEYKPGKAGITLNLGYIDYFGKTVDSISYSDFKYWPLMAGLKYYMGKTYLHGQAGAGFGSNGLGTSFWYGGGIGMNFSKAVDAELKYTGWNQGTVTKNNGGTTGYGGTGGGGGYGGHYPTIGLRLAYNF
jgi:hypothetical protein